MDGTGNYDGLNLSLSGMRSLPGMLEKLPHGIDARNLAAKLGVWTPGLHPTAAAEQRPLTPAKWSEMSDATLSDWNGYWNSEVHRTTELLGLIDGQKDMLTLQSKATRAAARSRVRREQERKEEEAARNADAPKAPKLTATQVNDLSEEDPAVIEIDQQLAMLAVIVASVKAYKEAAVTMTAGLSREISFRQAQMSSQLRHRS